MIEWIKILIELICFVVLITIVLIAYNYRVYKKITSKYATIDFKNFIELYNATPEKWEFDYQRSGSFLHMLYYDSHNKIDGGEDVFMSTFYEYYKLKKFYKNYKKAKKQKSKELLMKTLGQCWEKDIKN